MPFLYVNITSGYLALRGTPSTSGVDLVHMTRGQMVDYQGIKDTSTSPAWYKVKYPATITPNTEGWVRSDYLSTADPTGTPSVPVSGIIPYNRFAAYLFATNHGINYTSGYSVISGNKDCANFVSQCLYAGGIPMDSTWNYSNPYLTGTGSGAWNATNQLRIWLESVPWAWKMNTEGTKLTRAQVAGMNVKRGDLCFTYDTSGVPTSWAHVTIVTRDVGSNGDVYESGHTNDKSDALRDWQYTSQETNNKHAVFYRIMDSSTPFSGSYRKCTLCKCLNH